jgi:acyl-CoA synthetase (NDP forming)
VTSELAGFLSPASIAVIGASEGVEKIGGRIMNNLLRHKFRGRLFPINLGRAEVYGVRAYPDLASVPETIDLALIAIPAASVPGAIEDCAAKGIHRVVIASSGFADGGEEGAALQERVVAQARRAGIRIAGPNTQGFYNVPEAIAATFSPAVNVDPGPMGMRRRVGVVSQSGGLGFSLFNRGRMDGLDFSAIVSIGNQGDLELADYADLLLDDEQTKVVLLFIEAIKTPRKFIALARKAATLEKPLIVAKVGRFKAAKRAVASHTGSLGGSDSAYDAVFEANGVIRAESAEEMLETAALFTRHRVPRGPRLAVISATGGTAAWLTDTAEAHGLELPEIDAERRTQLMKFIPPYGSPWNPVDITAQGLRGYVPALEIVEPSPGHDAIILCITLAQEVRIAREGADIARIAQASQKPILIYTYATASEKSKAMMAEWDLHFFTRMEGCARALQSGLFYHRFQEARRANELASEAPSPEADLTLRFLAARGKIVCEYEAAELLARYGIDCMPGRLAQTAEEAVAAAAALGWPVALKIQSPQIPHKTEAGGVALNLADVAALRAAYARIMAASRNVAGVDIRGVLVQKMARPGIEMIAGIVADADFGPMAMCGAGGIHAELLGDVAFAPAPLTGMQAGTMLAKVKSAKLLDGVRGAAPADRASFVELLTKLARLASDARGRIAEIDLNPVIVHETGLSVVDALIVQKDEGP